MVDIIKRGGFREKAARQLKYKDSVNRRTAIDEQAHYVPEAERIHPINKNDSNVDVNNDANIGAEKDALNLTITDKK